jgi:hypothetical protein
LILAVPLTLTIVVIGQHIPRLEFLSVLLGKQEVLEPHEKLYHQLLAGDAAAAAEDADVCLNERGYARYLDETVIPSLQIASNDHRRTILRKEQLDRFKDSMTEYIAQISELLDFKSEQRSAETALSDEVTAPSKARSAVVIAGRGAIDQGAAELVAEAIRFDLRIPTQCSSLGGLTGISVSSGAIGDDAKPDMVVLISVGEVTAAQLTLLQNRARRVFEGAVIIIGYWSDLRESSDHKQGDDRLIFAGSVDSLLRTGRRIVSQCTITPNRPPPLKLV